MVGTEARIELRLQALLLLLVKKCLGDYNESMVTVALIISPLLVGASKG